MKFLFLDEFKPDVSKDVKAYGVCGVLVNSLHYPSFKKDFEDALADFGWDTKTHEFKGSHLFSKSGDKNISVEDRIDFVGKVVKLSKSKAGTNAKVHVISSFSVFPKSTSEFECYSECLKKVLLKLPKEKKT